MSLTEIKQAVKPTVLTPKEDNKLALTITNDQYGNLQEITESTMRANYTLRLKSELEKEPAAGQSSGGGNYLYPSYDVVSETITNPYPKGGYVSYSNAYGSNSGNCNPPFDNYL